MAKARTRKQNPRESSSQHSDEETLRNLESEWLAGRLRGEVDTTERLLDENYKGITSSGIVQTKSVFLQSVQVSRRHFTDSEYEDRNVLVHGDVAISTGIARLRSARRMHSFRYLRVFRKSGSEWKLLASQATRIPVA